MLAVPLLVHGAGIAPARAVPLSLLIVGTAGLIGAGVGAARRRMAWGAVPLLAATGAAGAQAGAALTARVPGPLLLLLFAGLMGVTAAGMWRRSRAGGAVRPERGGVAAEGLDPGPAAGDPGGAGRTAAPPRGRPLALAASGLGIGVLTGFLGVGGGFLIVPALVLTGGLDMHRAASTSLGLIAVNAAAGLLGHARAGRIDLSGSAPYVAATAGGMLVGLALGRRVRARRLQQAFAILVLGVAIATAGASVADLAGGAGGRR